MQRFRCWLLRRLLGDTFTITVRVNGLGFPIIPIWTVIALQPGNSGGCELPLMVVDDFDTLDPAEPFETGKRGFRRYRIKFLEKRKRKIVGAFFRPDYFYTK